MADVVKKKRKRGLKANYKGATPEQVGLAVLKRRKKTAKKTAKKKAGK